MKIKILFSAILLASSVWASAATNDLTSQLQQGLLDEEANHDLNSAIADYQALAVLFDHDRQIAATAIYRLGECYRKLGRTNDAVTAYQRLIRDFGDQPDLVTLSRQNLTGLGVQSPSSFNERLAQIIKSQASGITGASGTAGTSASTSDDEDQEILRVQTMMQNSPDLIVGNGAALCKAAGLGQMRVAAYLLDHGADPDGKDSQASPALALAAQSAQKSMVELLLSHGAKVDALDNGGGTPLLVAVHNNFPAVAEVLLAHHANVNAAYLNWENKKTSLHLAAGWGSERLVQMLLAAGANPHVTDDLGETPLLLAARAGAAGRVKLLLDAGADVNAVDQSGRTSLSYAAENGSLDSVKLLLAAKADPNRGTYNLPLLCAIYKRDLAVAELLLEAGAERSAASTVGQGIGTIQNGIDVTPMALAVGAGQLPMVQLLLKYKADPDGVPGHTAPIFSALSRPEILGALLDAGAGTELVTLDERELTPLGLAAEENDIPAVELLLKHGANPNSHNRNGVTPLHAAEYGLADGKVFELLLNGGANPNVRTGNGRTPLDELKIRLQDKSYDPARIAHIDLINHLIDLLHQHGALDKLPDWDHIQVSRPAAGYSAPVFFHGTNDWNQFTLLETILTYYESQLPQTGGYPPGNWSMTDGGSILPFPDLTGIVILRSSHSSTNQTRLTINLLNSTNGLDVTKDVSLEFGDLVEIPERDHALSDGPVGLTNDQRQILEQYLKGTFQLVVRGQKTALPVYRIGDHATVDYVLGRPEAQQCLLSSCDLSRVKVTRHDPKTGENREWILVCNPIPASERNGFPPFFRGRSMSSYKNPTLSQDLRLQDGDVVEVPEKP